MHELLSSGADTIILGVTAILGLYMATNIGANDLANAMGTSVGSGALSLKQAVMISMVFNLAGSVLAGSHVSDTIRKGMVDPSLFSGAPEILMLGMASALLSAGIWVHVATQWGLPISTTHSIVGAVVGFGVLAAGFGAVSWGKIGTIALSWVVSPLAGGIGAASVYAVIQKKILSSKSPYKRAKLYAPWLLAVVFIVLLLSVLFKGLKGLKLDLDFLEALYVALPVSLAVGFGGKALLKALERRNSQWLKGSEREKVERLFGYLQILTACYVAFAHGANDVANAIGPLAAIWSIVQTHSVLMDFDVPMWMLTVGGLAVGGGLFFYGPKVMETIGGRITEITPVRGFSAEFGAATTILICSRMGLPISTTHVLVGAVVGIGLIRGMGMIDLRVVRNIVSSWLITLPFTILLAMIVFTVLRTILL